jgi:ERCC4-related helicase
MLIADLPVSLRPYQIDCVRGIRAAFGFCRRVLFCLPTGGGKTVIFAYITSETAAKGKRVIILAHRAARPDPARPPDDETAGASRDGADAGAAAGYNL